MINMKRMCFFILLSMICTVINAQNSNNDLLKKLVEKQVLTQSEADTLAVSISKDEKDNSIGQSLEKIKNFYANTPYVKLGGYSLFWYRYNDTNGIKHDANARVIFLSMTGKLTDQISYFILADIVNPLVYELYADWKLNDALTFRAGQTKIPFSLENWMSLTILETALNTRSISSLVGMSGDVQQLQNGRNNTGRDVGIQAMGALPIGGMKDAVQYAFGVFQGSGIITSEKDNSKDFSGMLLFQPLQGFRVGGGAYFGEATYCKPDELSPSAHVRNRWVASTDYISDRFYGRAEWLYGNDGGIKKEGLYGMGQFYVLPKKLNVLAKVDYFNQDKVNNNEVIDYTAGINYYFYNQCRIGVNYTYSDYSVKWNAKNSNQLIAQLQIVF